MKQSRKNNLDEMQEQKLLQIERGGCWLAFWGLAAVLVVEIAVCGPDFQTVAGEWLVFMCLALYLVIRCIHSGIWDRRLQMNTRTNILASLIAGVIVAAISFAVVLTRFSKPVGAVAAALISGVCTFLLCMLALSLAMRQTKHRQRQLEEEPEDAGRM